MRVFLFILNVTLFSTKTKHYLHYLRIRGTMAIIINPVDGSLEFIGSKELADALEEALKERVEYECMEYMRTHSGVLNQLKHCKKHHYDSLTLKDLDDFIDSLKLQKIKTN